MPPVRSIVSMHLLILILIYGVSWGAEIDINGQFSKIETRTEVPVKWHIYVDAKAKGHVEHHYVRANETESGNAYFISNRSVAGSAALCLSKPVKKSHSSDHFTFSGQIKSNSTDGVVYVNIYSIHEETRKKTWGHALIRQGGVHDWTTETISFSLPETSSGFGINLIMNGTGEVWFRDLNLTRHDIPAPTVAAFEENHFYLVEPLSPANESVDGIYYDENPEKVLYYTPDKASIQTQAKVSVPLARNELTGFPITLFVPDPSESIEIDYVEGSIIRSIEPIHYWAQRRSDKTPSDAVMRAELIGFPSASNAEPLKRKSYWVEIDASLTDNLGLSQHEVHFTRAQSVYKLLLESDVKNFDLHKGQGNWGLWVDSNRWRSWSDHEILNELNKIRQTGYTSLILSDPGANKQTTSSEIYERVIDWSFVHRLMRLYERADFEGPPILSLQHLLKRINNMSGKSTYTMDSENKNEIEQIFLIVHRDWPSTVLFLDDELNRKSVAQKNAALVTYPLARGIGLRTFLTLTRVGNMVNEIPESDYLCYNGHAAAGSSLLFDSRAQEGQFPHWYGSGTYEDQEGAIYPNRLLTGFMNWKLGSTFHGTWTYQRPDDDPFNDFDGRRKDWCLTYPSANTSQPTIQWKAILLGINDYKYMATCKALIEAALSDESISNDELALEAQRFIQEITDKTPWFYDAELDGDMLNKWRTRLGSYCFELTHATK